MIGRELLSGENYGGCKVVFNEMNEAGVEIGFGLLHRPCTYLPACSLVKNLYGPSRVNQQKCSRVERNAREVKKCPESLTHLSVCAAGREGPRKGEAVRPLVRARRCLRLGTIHKGRPHQGGEGGLVQKQT